MTQNYPPLTGGIEMHVAQMAHSLSSRHEVTVTAMNFGNFSLPHRLAPLASNLLAKNNGHDRVDGSVRVLSLAPSWRDRWKMIPLLWRSAPLLQRRFYHAINRLTHPFYAWALRRRLTNAICHADIVHVMGGLDLGWASEKIARRYGIPVICTPFVHPRQWGDGPNDVAYYQRCAGVIGLVASDRDYLAKIGVPLSKLHVIGVSPSLLTSADSADLPRRTNSEDEPIILYIGRMVAGKGGKAIIEAAPLVWGRYPRARFIFIGPGSDEDIAIFKTCDDRIQYFGRVTEQVKAQMLASCAIFCLPSISEILPTVYLEAWGMRKPVIGGTAHGLRELVEGNQAGITAAQTAEAIAKAIVRLLSDTALAKELGNNGYRLVTERYSIEAVSGALEKLYECILRGAGQER